MDTAQLNLKPVMHECLQVELAKQLLAKRDASGLKVYMTRMKVFDMRTFQKMGTYLRNEDKDENIMKLKDVWDTVASSNDIPVE